LKKTFFNINKSAKMEPKQCQGKIKNGTQCKFKSKTVGV
jgi:hypothetical protein